MSNQMIDCIGRIPKEVLRDSKGEKHSNKTTWWSVEIQDVVREKRHYYKVWKGNKNTKNYEMYKAKNKVGK